MAARVAEGRVVDEDRVLERAHLVLHLAQALDGRGQVLGLFLHL